MDIKEQLKSNFTKVKRKRFLLYTDKYTEKKEIDEFGEEVKDVYHGNVFYCPCCGKMNFVKEFYTLKEGCQFPEGWVAEKSTIPNSYRCDSIQDLLVKKGNNILLTCPECKEDVTDYDKWYLKCGSDYVFDNWLLDAYSYFIDEENGKISFTLFFITLFPNTDAGKLAINNYNFKVIFNVKTGQSYILEIRKTDGKKNRPKWVTGARLKNVTYGGISCCSNIVCNCLRNNEILKKMLDILISYNKRSWDDLLFDGNTLDDIFKEDASPWWGRNTLKNAEGKTIGIDFGIVTIYNKFCNLGFSRNFYNYLRDTIQEKQRHGHRNDWRKIRNMLLLISNSDNAVSAVESVIIKHKIPQKKKIKKIVYDNPLIVFNYKTILSLGFKDYNIVMDLLENYYEQIDFIKSNCYNDDFDKVIVFISDMIALKGEPTSKKLIVSIRYGHDAKNWLIDSARMYYRIKEEDMVNPKSLKGTLREIHDNLTTDYKKVRFKNKTIPYNEEELKLNEEIDGFKFILAKDTHQLIDVGNYMGICVGSYGEGAYNKNLIIVTMIQDGKYVGCIELSKDGKVLRQAKAKYNNVLQEQKAEALKKWVEAKKIDGSKCYDYKHILDDNICYDEDKIYQGTHNYADYGMPFWDF